jgi:hypothetical protein
VACDQLNENINAIMELRKGGKTVHASEEHAAKSTSAGLSFTGDTGAFMNKAEEAGQCEGETVDKE